MVNYKDERREIRSRQRIYASLVLSDEITRYRVLVINRSNSGVTVELVENVTLSEKLRLLVDHSIELYSLVWQRGRLAGLRLKNQDDE